MDDKPIDFGARCMITNNKFEYTLFASSTGIIEIIMRGNDLYTIFMREQVYSIYRYHSSDYIV